MEEDADTAGEAVAHRRDATEGRNEDAGVLANAGCAAATYAATAAVASMDALPTARLAAMAEVGRGRCRRDGLTLSAAGSDAVTDNCAERIRGGEAGGIATVAPAPSALPSAAE